MLMTYRAILKGNQLEWHDSVPDFVSQKPLLVQVTILEEPNILTPSSQGKAMAAALSQLAALGGATSIEDAT